MYQSAAGASRSAGTPLRDLLIERIAAGTFSRRPGRIRRRVPCKQVAEGRTETKTIEIKDGRVITVVSRPMRGRRLAGDPYGRDRTIARREGARLAAPARTAAPRRSTRQSPRSASGSETVLKTVSHSATAMKAAAQYAAWRPPITRCSAPKARFGKSNRASLQRGDRGLRRRGAVDDRSARSASDSGGPTRSCCSAADAARHRRTGRSLADAARKIGDVVKLVQEVAGRPTCSALNATVEAARAGDAGRASRWWPRRSIAGGAARKGDRGDRAVGPAAVQGLDRPRATPLAASPSVCRRSISCTATVTASVVRREAATGGISQNVASAARDTKEIMAALGEVPAGCRDAKSAGTVLAASEDVEKATAEVRAEVEEFLSTVAA